MNCLNLKHFYFAGTRCHDLGHAHIDIGRIAAQYFFEGDDKDSTGKKVSLEDYVAQQVSGLIGLKQKPLSAPKTWCYMVLVVLAG